MTTVTIYHNISRDSSFGLNAVFTSEGKRFAETPDEWHELVRVFEYQVPTPARLADVHELLGTAFETFNVGSDELAARYRGGRLRSVSLPGISPCCSRSCCLRYRPVSQVVVEAAGRADVL